MGKSKTARKSAPKGKEKEAKRGYQLVDLERGRLIYWSDHPEGITRETAEHLSRDLIIPHKIIKVMPEEYYEDE